MSRKYTFVPTTPEPDLDWKQKIENLAEIEVGFDCPNLVRSFEVYLRLKALTYNAPFQGEAWSTYQTLVNHWEVENEDIISFFKEMGYECISVDHEYGPWGQEDCILLQAIFVTQDKLQHVFRKMGYGTKNDQIKIRTFGLGPEAIADRYLFLEIFGQYQVQGQAHSQSVHVLVPRAHGPGYEFTWAGVSGHSFDPNLYPPEHKEGFFRIQEALTSPRPDGRLVLLSGPPGTGKTYFLRGLIESVEGYFVLIPSSMVEHIGDPTLMQAFLQHKSESGSDSNPLILLIEDADKCLVTRAADNMAALSNLLNMCDGILGDALDLRVVATTNAKQVEVDEAITREGRLHTSLTFRHFNREEAEEIYIHLTGQKTYLTGEEPERMGAKMTLAEIFSKARPHIPPKPKVSTLPSDLPDTTRVRFALRMEEWKRVHQTKVEDATQESLVIQRTLPPDRAELSRISNKRLEEMFGSEEALELRKSLRNIEPLEPGKFRFPREKKQKPGF